MSDIHISDFYKDVANILLRLYSCFPRKTILYVEDISGADEPDEFGLHSERFLAGFSAMVWLGDYDYLQYEAPIRQEALDQAVLTQRGFLMLSSRSALSETPLCDDTADSLPPSVIEESMSNVAQLRKALRSGSSTQIQHRVHCMLSNSFLRKKQ